MALITTTMFKHLKKAVVWYCTESAKFFDDSLHTN